METNLDETVSSELNDSENQSGTNANNTKKTRGFGVGNQGICAKQKNKRTYSKKRKYHGPKKKKKVEATCFSFVFFCYLLFSQYILL